MYCIGLTGSIASGKSTVASFFKRKGVSVISADEISREITAPDGIALAMIVRHFGESIITANGELNRTALRHIIFQNPNERLWLEHLLHPLIRRRIMEEVKRSNSPYNMIEIPLLKDRDLYPYLNRILLITADKEQQIKRVMARDQCSRQQAEAILAAQPPDHARERIADDIIINHGSKQELELKIDNLHQQYLQFAKQIDM
ncbi:dephospho-CoA kinase [Legionella jordanis]|uniref:Dephospho-CoA kinase n=1 Tax=Legionella jordanis TaxID=456 RepID=A0A0W0VC90_9GAMM|nr:dephospho-CoA kinase [Legionella jordanis]KTD17241.1 dephospho-CoA kinase [Legionella jordanis]RMX03356.1 dephospho-CoA kinase [Legionella jordanis]RMX15834.1 dephospho-CoA kinase [Legionella jordanis]VEH12561.1 dephospho-CoA kinase [Legionella jordanis]